MRHQSCAQGCSHTLRVGGQHACPVELKTYLEVVRHFIVVADVQRNLAVLLVLDVALFVGIARTCLLYTSYVADGVCRFTATEPYVQDGGHMFLLPGERQRPAGEEG